MLAIIKLLYLHLKLSSSVQWRGVGVSPITLVITGSRNAPQTKPFLQQKNDGGVTCRSYSYHAGYGWECYSFKSSPSQFSGVRGVDRSNSSNHQCWHRLLVGISHNQMPFPSVKWGIGLWVEGFHKTPSVLPRGAKGCPSNALMYYMYKWRCRGLVVCM